jgi:heat shock protein HtpX
VVAKIVSGVTRILLFLATNLAVLLVVSIVAQLLGIHAEQYTGLLVISALLGFGGALVSLALSKWIAIHTMGCRVIDQPGSPAEQDLVAIVTHLAQAAGIGQPQVAIFDSPQPNAFATGARRDAALVAVSTGLLGTMNRDQVEGVLGHEITHVANGDMVTLALIQGVVNTFVFFLSRVLGEVIDNALSGGRDRDHYRGRGGIGYFVTVMVLQTLFGIVASMIVYWFSRRREFRADAGGARLAGREKMIGALERLQAAHDGSLPQQLKAFGISSDTRAGIARLFMTHPPLEERIARLRSLTLGP